MMAVAMLWTASLGLGAAAIECPAAAAAPMERGWAEYHAGRMDAAEAGFEEALRRCPELIGARIALGYVDLREARLERARERFRQAVRGAPDDVDAWVGLGLVAWRSGDLEAVHQAFTRAQRLDPDRPEPREYLARLPAGVGPAPQRPPLVLPDTTVYPARVNGSRFEVRTPDGWAPFYAHGVNLGAALPGRHPSEFPDSAVYAGWLRSMGEMGANTIRLYTIHPPHFYGAVAAYNRANPDAPLWLLHGVWAELPPEHDYTDPRWEGDFFAEMHRVVDVLHGRADLRPRPGHASGHYTADVSPWVLGYIIGREWEPYSVSGFNALRPDLTRWEGTYLRVEHGTPMEVWLAKASEEIVAYEMATYRAQRPVAYTNWPTLDHLHHPTESTVDEELAIREAIGDPAERRPLEYDNDGESLDATRVRTTAALPAGYFAAFHPYPYYPDFMILDPEYARAASSLGRSNYFGYLRRLKAAHPDIPVVVAEYGVPASLGNAHLQPQGWHHGGHGEGAMARINERLTREIAESGMAGALLFAWIDEWFKKNWLVIDFEIPLERNRLWLNRLDPEQQYGVYAMEPERLLPGATLQERLPAWADVDPLYVSAGGTRVRALADAAHLWILVEERGDPGDELYLGFDMVRPGAGSFRWPGAVGPRLPVGIEFALVRRGDDVRLLADPRSNPWRIEPAGAMLTGSPVAPRIEDAPPGFFQGRFRQAFNRPYLTLPREDGVFEPLRVVTNRRRFGRDGTEYAALGYDRGVLLEGPLPDGNWEAAAGMFEVRIPWMLLNVTDPSERRVLQDPLTGELGDELGTERVDGIRIVAATRHGRRWSTLPESGVAGDVPLFTWDAWEEPRWTARRRPQFEALRRAYREIRPAVLEDAP
jgi:hypothetical protein